MDPVFHFEPPKWTTLPYPQPKPCAATPDCAMPVLSLLFHALCLGMWYTVVFAFLLLPSLPVVGLLECIVYRGKESSPRWRQLAASFVVLSTSLLFYLVYPFVSGGFVYFLAGLNQWIATGQWVV